MLPFLLVVLGIAALLFIIAFFIWGIKLAFMIALNSLVGFFALYAIQAFLIPSILINWWSVLLVALLGIFGFAAVLILHAFGIWF